MCAHPVKIPFAQDFSLPALFLSNEMHTELFSPRSTLHFTTIQSIRIHHSTRFISSITHACIGSSRSRAVCRSIGAVEMAGPAQQYVGPVKAGTGAGARAAGWAARWRALCLRASPALNAQVMQPAFGMAEVCTCMTYSTRFKVAPRPLCDGCQKALMGVPTATHPYRALPRAHPVTLMAHKPCWLLSRVPSV